MSREHTAKIEVKDVLVYGGILPNYGACRGLPGLV